MSAVPPEQVPPEQVPDEGPLEVPPPTMTPRLASAGLLLEAFVVFFATIVASRFLPDAGRASVVGVFAVGGVLTLLFLLASGVVRRPGGLALGVGLQVLLVVLGVFVPVMFIVGAGFAALWGWLVGIGQRVDRDRRAWAADLAAGGTGRAGGAGSAPLTPR